MLTFIHYVLIHEDNRPSWCFWCLPLVPQRMELQTWCCPAPWWKTESAIMEWAPPSRGLQLLSSLEMLQWLLTNHWKLLLSSSRPQSLTQTSLCLRPKVLFFSTCKVWCDIIRTMCWTSHPSVAVSSVEVPGADVLLHADCNEQEVMCEISRYALRGSQEGSDPAYFMVSINVEGVEFSTALILQTTVVEKDPTTLMQSKLGLPLSQSGCLPTEGEMQCLEISHFIIGHFPFLVASHGQ